MWYKSMGLTVRDLEFRYPYIFWHMVGGRTNVYTLELYFLFCKMEKTISLPIALIVTKCKLQLCPLSACFLSSNTWISSWFFLYKLKPGKRVSKKNYLFSSCLFLPLQTQGKPLMFKSIHCLGKNQQRKINAKAPGNRSCCLHLCGLFSGWYRGNNESFSYLLHCSLEIDYMKMRHSRVMAPFTTK